MVQPSKSFQGAKVEAEGYGLGLAISKLIITSHGGHIGVSSNPGMGSRFGCRLKVARDALV